MKPEATSPRVLVFSQRNIFKQAFFRAAHFEFEDLITRFDDAEVLSPEVEAWNSRHLMANRVAFHAPIALNPGLPPITLSGKYDLFLAVCGRVPDLLMVNAVRNWEETCKTSICLIDELWVKEFDQYKHFLHILKRFDLVLLYYSQTVAPLHERIGVRCEFVPPGVDALGLCPYPAPPKRVIDVYSMGRRSAITHQSLLELAARSNLFYLHDTASGDKAIDLKEHRSLFTNIAKRSRYFIVNPGLIDRPDKRGDQIEIGNRYFEGAAAGTIMVGERPDNGQFSKLFDWPDAILHLPYDSANIGSIIEELDNNPEREERIRRANATNALLRHDWAYRWEKILGMAGLEPMPELSRRKVELQRLAEAIANNHS
jgi:hypothetical protein